MFFSTGFRQVLVAGSPQLAALSVGGVVGYPGVLLHQLRDNDSSIEVDFNTATWIGSLHGLAGIPSILMPLIMQWKGRKFSFIVACTLIIIGCIFAYIANNITLLLISETFHGLGTNSILAVSLSSMGEMIAPRFRNISLQSFSLMQSLGMALVGIAGRFLHWKTLSLVISGPVILALLLACLWPESPSWLACKGDFDRCEKAFKWLRGNDDESNVELQELINAQKEILTSNRKRESKSVFRKMFNQICSKDFYIPGLHMLVMLCAVYWSGIMVIIIYSVQMLEKVTSSQNATFNGPIIINIVLFTGFSITAILIRRFNNKPVLLISLLGTAISLLGASIVTYMQKSEFLAKDSLLSVGFILSCMICASLGLSSIVFGMATELMPVKHRGLGGALFVIYTCVLHTTSLKFAPYMFLHIEMWGTFLVYSINAISCCLFIWKYVPETKNRTLQEIEDYYMYGKFDINRKYQELNCIIRSR